LHFIRRTFSNQGTASIIFAQICPKRGKLKRDLQKTVCIFILDAIFVKSKEHISILQKFTHIMPGFSPNQKVWGCGCTPASYTSGQGGARRFHLLAQLCKYNFLTSQQLEGRFLR